MVTTDTSQRLESQLERTWKQLARDRYIGNAAAQEEPIAIAVAGQPGAGKSALTQAARRLLRDHGGCATIDPGELLQLHPAYSVYAAKDDYQVDALLRPAAARLAADLLQDAVTRRTHMVLECTFEDADSAEALAEYLQAEKYHLTLIVPVVSQQTSWRVLERRLSKQRAALGLGRRIDKEYHDRVCRELVSSVGRLAQMTLVDELWLVSRDGSVLSRMDSATALAAAAVRDVFAQIGGADDDAQAGDESDAIINWEQYTEQEQKDIRRRIELQEILHRCAEQERHGGY